MKKNNIGGKTISEYLTPKTGTTSSNLFLINLPKMNQSIRDIANNSELLKKLPNK